MKTFPIRVEKLLKSEVKVIEWMIHNVGNNDCSFCSPEYKNGSIRWLPFTQYQYIADQAISAANGAPVWFQITGGEPTLYPKLVPLIQYIKGKGHT